MAYDDSASRKLPALTGWKWFLEGVRATRSAPVSMTGIVLFYLIVAGGLSVLPIVGFVLAAFFMPFGTVFIGRSTRDVLAGKVPSYAVFAELWKEAAVRRSLVSVGLVYSIFLVAVEALYAYLAADDISQWVISDQGQIDWESVSSHFPWDGVIASIIVYIPGLMAVWFAPLLVAQKRMTAGKALFYSFFGCLRNIVPVIVLLASLTALAAVSVVAVVSITLMLNSEVLASWLSIPFIFLTATVMYASYWPMYRDLFDDAAGTRP